MCIIYLSIRDFIIEGTNKNGENWYNKNNQFTVWVINVYFEVIFIYVTEDSISKVVCWEDRDDVYIEVICISATEDPIPKVDLLTIEVTVICQMFILRFQFSLWGPDTQGGPVDYRGDSDLSDVYIEVPFQPLRTRYPRWTCRL